ncbi:MAG: hypothetical protein ACM3ZQ_08220 [Bacillota bacterium]
MPKKDGKIEPQGSPPYEHSFFKWGSTNPEMVQEANRLMKHRKQEQMGEEDQSSPRCPKS